jgi:hypothetical protein
MAVRGCAAARGRTADPAGGGLGLRYDGRRGPRRSDVCIGWRSEQVGRAEREGHQGRGHATRLGRANTPLVEVAPGTIAPASTPIHCSISAA